MIIYKITNNTNGKIYIGQTVRTLKDRMGEHIRHNRLIIQKAIHKYGIENFSFNVIDKAQNIEELNKKEIKWINFYKCLVPFGYNQCIGGDNTMGFHHREVSKRMMSIKKSKMYLGKNNPFFGKTHSEEQRAKWSEERKGRNLDKAREASIKVIQRKVLNVDTGEIFDSIKDAATKYDLKPTHITRVCKGKRKHTGGFEWKYVD